ncbi:helix-turn-helix transcriptional regulator [Thauera linaloolentis]|uniref:helix-turn-helix transcriptional regulator n=1 Tax=Thauera linaloolentis TaxID=76112 RepID=UPI0033130980
MKSRGWTQRRLAQELGLPEQNLTHIMKGRRGIPAHALIKLERLRGTDDHSIIEQLLRTAACVALAAVLFFGSASTNPAYASSSYSAEMPVIQIIALLWLSAAPVYNAPRHRSMRGWRNW